MFRVTVPATSGNIGIGFDTAGLAVDIFNYVDFEARPSGLVIETPGAAFAVPRDGRNLIYRAAKKAAQTIGKPLPGLYMKQYGNIPHTRGLGSSAACIVAGIMIAEILLGHPLSQSERLEIATVMEGHPDNAAPAIYGGVCISVQDGRQIITSPIAVKNDLMVAVLVPDFTLSTRRAREVLPKAVSVPDAVHNIGRMGLFVSALYSGDYSLLRVALDDRLHQPYRKGLIQNFDRVVQAALSAGAYGACLSGAGPTILAFAPDDSAFLPRLEERLQGIGGGWKPLLVPFNQRGAFVQAL